MIIITSKKPGFRRCGMAHPAEPTEYADDAFTAEQIEALHAEPMLIVLEAGEAEAELTNKQVPARQLISLIKQASADDLQRMTEGETRKQVLDAIEARRKELDG
jgi:hypothetical protein